MTDVWTCRECETENDVEADPRNARDCRSCGCVRTESSWVADAIASASAPVIVDNTVTLYDYDDVVVVTRHMALVTYLELTGVIEKDTPVIQHATAEAVAGRHIIGVLPYRLAALAQSVTEIPLDVPAELRGKELTIAQIREFASDPVTYKVARQ